MASGLHQYTKGGNLKKASYAKVAKWVSAAWNAVQPSIIVSGFSEAEIISDRPSEVVVMNADEELVLDSSDDDLNDEELLRMFQSESEDSYFDGF